MKRKGQLQIQETLIVIFILVIIILVGLVVFYKFSASSLEQESEENKILRYNALLATLPESGEIKCSMYGLEDNCIDTYRVMVVNTLYHIDPNYKNYLFERYGFADIRLKVLYPYENKNVCKSNNQKDCGVWEFYSHIPADYSGELIINTPVSLYLPGEEMYVIGELEIVRYIID